MGYHDYYQSVLLVFSFSFSFEACVFGWSLSWVNHMLTDLHSTFSGKMQIFVPNLAVNMRSHCTTVHMCNTVINEMCMWYNHIIYVLQIKNRSHILICFGFTLFWASVLFALLQLQRKPRKKNIWGFNIFEPMNWATCMKPRWAGQVQVQFIQSSFTHTFLGLCFAKFFFRCSD